MAFTKLFQVCLFVSLLASCSCIAGTNDELGSPGQGGGGNLVSYLMLKVVSGLETDIQELKAEVEDTQELKTDVQKLKAEAANIQKLKADIADLKSKYKDMQELKAEVANMKELKADVTDTQELKIEVAEMQELKVEVANVEKLKAEIADLKSKYKDQPKTVFAQMQLLGTKTYQPGDRVYFTSTIANVENAYDTQHGYFEAPLDGTYLFSVTLCTSHSNWVEFRIVHDDNDIGEGVSGDKDYTACASRTAVTQMKSGSRVWVEIDKIGGGGTVNSRHGVPAFTGVFLNNYQNP